MLPESNDGHDAKKCCRCGGLVARMKSPKPLPQQIF